MSAERLREAAKVLRERASRCETGQPWDYMTWTNYGLDGPDATYIATMHPGVGLALADWLDKQAVTYLQDWSDRWVEQAALTVADAILGVAS